MKLELTIPTKVSEIPLKHYQDFQKVAQGSNDDEFIAQKMIEIFCGIELKEVVKIKLTDVNNMVDHFAKLFQEKHELKTIFKIKDIEFGFIPNLEEISFGEYIDLENHLQDVQNFHKAMAVMYRPITRKVKDKYEIEEYNGTATWAELMRFTPLDVALGAMLFFYHLGSELLTALAHYLEKEVQTLTNTPSKDSSANNGDGIIASMHSLKGILPDLIQLPENDLLNVLRSSRLKSKRTK